MSRVRTLFASLALASSLLGCAVPHAEARSVTPMHGEVAPDRARMPIKIMPTAPKVTRQQVRAKLAERRKLTIQRFLAYREARVYPVNTNVGVPGAMHIWLDEFGNLCAAATIIAQDWGREASVNVSRENNNIALADVTEGELYNWILTSGMTQAEIVAIQAPGFAGGGLRDPEEPSRLAEVTRLYQLYTDVERQIRSLDKHNLDLAVDELMKHPQLARELVNGKTASAGHFGKPSNVDRIGYEPSLPVAPPTEPTVGFAQPPPA
ncbi:MAG: hypothetical protein AB7T06_22950 [Kofleriaceae bacterium]